MDTAKDVASLLDEAWASPLSAKPAKSRTPPPPLEGQASGDRTSLAKAQPQAHADASKGLAHVLFRDSLSADAECSTEGGNGGDKQSTADAESVHSFVTAAESAAESHTGTEKDTERELHEALGDRKEALSAGPATEGAAVCQVPAAIPSAAYDSGLGPASPFVTAFIMLTSPLWLPLLSLLFLPLVLAWAFIACASLLTASFLGFVGSLLSSFFGGPPMRRGQLC